MKIRYTINNNYEEYAATVYEDKNKIIVCKRLTNNYFDHSTDEWFEFQTINEYQNWLNSQDWVNLDKIHCVHPFMKRF